MPAMTPNFSEKRYLSSKEKTYSLSCRCRNLTDFYVLLHNCYDLNMNIDNLDIVKQLIAEKENGQVEFKETTGQLERGMETLCAFLNGEGGTVLFGVTDKGKIIGQEVSDKTKRDIAEAINRLEPITAVHISYVPLQDSEKKVIAFHVEDARLNRPFCYKGRPYMRVESVTTTMPQTTHITSCCYNATARDTDGNNSGTMT